MASALSCPGHSHGPGAALAAVLVPEPPWPQSPSLSLPGCSHGRGTAAGATLSRSSQASQPLSEYVPPSVSLHWSGAGPVHVCRSQFSPTGVSGSRTGLRKTAGANSKARLLFIALGPAEWRWLFIALGPAAQEPCFWRRFPAGPRALTPPDLLCVLASGLRASSHSR